MRHNENETGAPPFSSASALLSDHPADADARQNRSSRRRKTVPDLREESRPFPEDAFGHFSEDGREYVVTRMDTPRPWLNYAWNEHFLVSMDQRGQGGNFFRDGDGNCSHAIDQRFVYLKDGETGDCWTVGWGVIRLPLSASRCRPVVGYTVLCCEHRDWAAEWTISAAPDAAEVWKLVVTNRSARPRKLSVYSGVRFSLGGWTPYGSLENYAWAKRCSDRCLAAGNRADERPGVRNDAFFLSSVAARQTETSLREFLGGCYGEWHDPAGVRAEALGGHDAMNEELVGVFQHDLELPPQREWTAYFANGSCFDAEAEAPAMAAMSEERFAAALAAARARTRSFSRTGLEIRGERQWNVLFDVWAKQQLMLLKDFARIFLMGFRDTLQDATALAAYEPATAARSIRRTLGYQNADGSALRGWCPLDKHKYADSGVWLAMAVAEYLRETADVNFLDTRQRFFDGGDGTVWEHTVRSLDWFEDNLGGHGLPKLYFGDWNDSLNIGRQGKGESVWLGMALVVALEDAAAVAAYAGRPEAETFRNRAARLRDTIERHAWDGRWYLRGFTDQGEPVGGRASPAGFIFSEPQSWAVMARLDPARLALVRQAVAERLETPTGLKVCDPPFTRYRADYGRISTMLPGWGENGSCYCHVTAFQAVAYALMRDGDAAFRALLSIMPFNPNARVETTRLEPYAFSNMFRGPDNVRPGETFKGWTSGTVPWALRCLTHYVFGVRPDFDALHVDPVLPGHWKEVVVHRAFRSAELEIVLRNQKSAAGTAPRTTLFLDGASMPSTALPVAALTPGKHRIEALVE